MKKRNVKSARSERKLKGKLLLLLLRRKERQISKQDFWLKSQRKKG